MIYRIKRFSKIKLLETTRDNYTDYEWVVDDQPNKILGKIVGTTKKYDEDAKSLGEVSKRKIKKLKEELKNGYVFHSPPGDPNESDTHCLGKHSKPKAALDDNKQITCSKDINQNDRFVYKVKFPVPSSEKSNDIIFPIVLNSCKGHWRYGVGNYSENYRK